MCQLRRHYLYVFFLFFCTFVWAQDASSWRSIRSTGKGTIVVYWHPSMTVPSTGKEGLDAAEHELILSFAKYLEKKHNVRIAVEWRQTKSFNEVLNSITSARNGTLGASSISITPERKEVLQFTPPFFPDISVLISHGGFPIAKTADDFSAIFRDAVIVTIPNTTLERELLLLKDGRGLKSDLIYVENGGQVLDRIQRTPNTFGYLDLPNFLRSLKSHTSVKRQYFYPLKLEGLSFVFPKDSDWDVPVNDYFTSEQFELDKHRIITKYLGNDVTDLIERISLSVDIGPYEEIILLTEEKELQAQELLQAAIREHERQRLINWLIVGVVLVVLIALLLYVRYFLKAKANVALAEKQRLIEQHNEQLLELNLEKNNLIRVVAHDLRNPVNQMLSLSDMLLSDKRQLADDQVQIVSFIKQASERLRGMISKILDVDAIESGSRNVSIEPVDLEPIMEQLVVQFSPRAEAKGIKLEVKPEKVGVLADGVYLRQILENLISNALKFSSRETTVRLHCKESAHAVTLIVSDQGPGFTEEDQKRIFKKYQQLSAVSTAGEPSTGLGLSIVKMYTELMNGSVTYQTEQGKGTEFFVTLPKAV